MFLNLSFADFREIPIDITELRDIHMPGYVEAIANNVGTIMPSFSSWNGKKMHEQDELLNGILKNPLDMNFQGFLA